jgi:HlyD family secretion protein
MNAIAPANAALRALVLASLLLGASGCSRPKPDYYQGYVETEFVYVAAPLSGELANLAVQRGQAVSPGTLLFELEHAAEASALAQARAQQAAASARWADLREGSRPTELAAIEARLAQARATAELSGRERDRQAALFEQQVNSASDYDRARLAHERDRQLVEELTAQLATARLGGRAGALAAAEAEVAAAGAAVARAAWAIEQKSARSSVAGTIYDTLYRSGEYVAAGRPIVSILPEQNRRVRFFVPEPELGRISIGETVRVRRSSGEPVEAKVVFVSPTPEYTPPVLYNRDNRARLVFRIEAELPPADATNWHPGQPVDVALISGRAP